MELDPELRPIVDLVASVEQAPPTEDAVPELRAAFAGLASMLGSGATEVEVTGRTAPGPAGEVPVRIYRPPTSDDTPLAALVWYHGGGWVIGDLDTHDALCRDLAVACSCAVVSVGYRLAPEHRYPAAHDDAVAAAEWLLGHAGELGIDPARVALGGDSAGGHLATVTARRLRDRGLAAQVLVYPVTDLAAGPQEHPSRHENATGYLLTTETMDFFTDTYLPDSERRGDPDASPLRCDDLGGLPPALVVVAQFDPLRDEGIAYAERLRASGVPTTLEHLHGGVHLCAQMSSTAIGREVLATIAGFLTQGTGRT